MSKQHIFATQKVSLILNCTKEMNKQTWPAGHIGCCLLLLCPPDAPAQLKHCAQLWGTQHKKDVELLKWVQRKIMRMIRGLEHLCYEDKETKFCSLGKVSERHY